MKKHMVGIILMVLLVIVTTPAFAMFHNNPDFLYSSTGNISCGPTCYKWKNIIIIIELFIVGFLLYLSLSKLSKWSINAITPIERIGLINMYFAVAVIAYMALHWNLTENNFIYLKAQLSPDGFHIILEESILDFLNVRKYHLLTSSCLFILGIIMYSGYFEKFIDWIKYGKING